MCSLKRLLGSEGVTDSRVKVPSKGRAYGYSSWVLRALLPGQLSPAALAHLLYECVINLEICSTLLFWCPVSRAECFDHAVS